MIRYWLGFAFTCLMVVTGGLPLVIVGLFYRSRRALAWVSCFWVRHLLSIAGMRLTIKGAEDLASDQPAFFVGNHQSALDIPILIVARRGDVRFMAKKALFWVPIFGWVLRLYGYIPIDRARARVTLDALSRMYDRVEREPISLVAFPEGTRSADGQLLPFRKGVMKICRRVGLPIVPFAIAGSCEVTPRNRLRAYPGPVRLTFGRPIPAREVAEMSNEQLHDRLRRTIGDMLGQPTESAPPETGFLRVAEGI